MGVRRTQGCAHQADGDQYEGRSKTGKQGNAIHMGSLQLQEFDLTTQNSDMSI
jgi:hypothetical protein